MKLAQRIAVGVLMAGGLGVAAAAPTAEELKQLGTTLTAWGAEKAGNKEGTIPAYTGGIANPPKFDYATGIWPDPFANDKVSFTIDSTNMEKYADKLTPATKLLLQKYPKFRLEVYPTRRSASYPQQVLDNTLKNATRCSLSADGETLDVSKGCRGGFPFPIPKTGYEAMWNKHARYYGAGTISAPTDSSYIKPSGERVITSRAWSYNDNGLYDPDTAVPVRHWGIRVEYSGPARILGQATVIYDELNGSRKSWSYQPATRRVRLAPDLAADTPIGTAGGATTYDEMNMFAGVMDRWDMKLIGKKEMYIPYNSTKWGTTPGCMTSAELTPALHPNPACMRWELHRVWEVQATLKSGKRHIYSKRHYYYDEDAWFGGSQEQYDQEGKLYRVQFVGLIPDYVKHAPASLSQAVSLDFNNGVYFASRPMQMWTLDKPLAKSVMGPESMTSPVLKAPQ